MAAVTPLKKKKTVVRATPRGAMYVTATFNNTIITITDELGKTLCWSSTGKMGFSGSRKSTPYAATVAIEKVLEDARIWGIHDLKVYIKGPGAGRDAALRVLKNQPFKISLLADVTPIAHNGTRPRKKKHNR